MTKEVDALAKEDIVKGYIIDACVQVANIKGYSDASGVLRGTLFLALEPLSMDDLVYETGYSKSTVSATMPLLENLGLVRRIVKPGDKRYHYVPVTNMDDLRSAMMTQVKKEVNLLLKALDLAERYLAEAGVEDTEIRDRILSIRDFYYKAERVLDLMASYTTDELIENLEKARK